ncbi:MAG: hypothetical protein KDE45_22170, partial [Caldilineaceae bacterium]|nr:hypothetical protein [Caldilineaceae bacterium]
RVLRKPEELEALLAEYIDLMQLMVLDQFAPLYNGDPTEAEWRKLDAMIPHKRLPGRQSAGLLLAQKHATVASARVLKKYRDATWLIGDPGTGKSAMGYSIAHSLDAFPVLVSTPAHLVEKHKR